MNRLLSSLHPDVEPKLYSFFYFHETKERHIKLLPNCHSAYYPLEFEKDSKKVTQGELNFFNSKFYNNYYSPQIIKETDFSFPKPAVAKKGKAIVLNVLDDCFGHSIIKILNLQNIYEKYGEEYDLICICPRALAYLIPDEKFIKIIVKIGFYELSKCYDLQPILDKINKEYQKTEHFLFSMYNQFDRKSISKSYNFFPDDYGITNGKRNITFYYRTEFFRSWGGNNQAKLITSLFKTLKPFFSNQVQFVIVGDKDEHIFPTWIKDNRVESFSLKVDLEYNTIFSESIFTIGFFGSALYLPSILCDNVIHLVPRDKLKLLMEDSLNYNDSSILSHYHNVNIFGNELCIDVKPIDLANKMIGLYKSYLEKIYKSNLISSATPYVNGQKSYIVENYTNFNYEKAVSNEALVSEEVNKKMFFKNKLRRLFRIFN